MIAASVRWLLWMTQLQDIVSTGKMLNWPVEYLNIFSQYLSFSIIYYASILNPTFQLDYWNLYCTLKILKYSAGQFNILPPVLTLSGSCVIHSSHLTEAAIMEITYFLLTPPVKSHVSGQYREF